jgi:hypothetical protein
MNPLRALILCACLGSLLAAETTIDLVHGGSLLSPHTVRGEWQETSAGLTASGTASSLRVPATIGKGDFRIHLRLSLKQLDGTAAQLGLGIANNRLLFDAKPDGTIKVGGKLFGQPGIHLAPAVEILRAGEPFDCELVRKGKQLTLRIAGKTLFDGPTYDGPVGTPVLRPWRSTMSVQEFSITGNIEELAMVPTAAKEITIPTVDISGDDARQTVIAAGTPEVYQGHPTTVLMPDGTTIFCVWTYNHGGECGPLAKSSDGGRTWSGLLPVHPSWKDARNCPAIYRLTAPDGTARLVVFAMTKSREICRSFSEDDGETWSPMESIGGTKVVMPICTIIPLADGRLLGMTNARRADDPDPYSNNVIQSISEDGGLTWGEFRVVCDLPGLKPCEPCLIRSPDGKQLLCLLRQNTREFNSMMMTSDDEGKTWSEAVELPASLTGDRHTARYLPDGRLVVVFRDVARKSPSYNHFAGWVGTYDDIVNGREGQYRVKLLHSHAGMDVGYPGLELLPDGTLVATTYVKYRPGEAKHSVVCTRFTISELDALAAKAAK